MERVNIFWFRRDLRLEDNCGLYHALLQGRPLIALFIFDTEILDKLKDPADARVSFIYSALEALNLELAKWGSSIWILKGNPLSVWKKVLDCYSVETVFTNRDYEPYARERDPSITTLLREYGIGFQEFKDQVIFERDEVVKDDGKPYTVFTPYKRKWLSRLAPENVLCFSSSTILKLGKARYYPKNDFSFPSLQEIGFSKSSVALPSKAYTSVLENYAEERNFPARDSTSRISVHLRFGTISIRELVRVSQTISEAWLSELIWREFYFMILWHFPHTEKAFRSDYDKIPWRYSEPDFQKWCAGVTGYPLVDAGMRELNETGFMHNRVRMVVASFLTKHLLIDWRWGEAYFAEKLLDFELSSNNGGWQWAAGCGVDAAPYFRIFNPYEQEKKFDPEHKYIRHWVKEWNTGRYPLPMVDHPFARARCLDVFQKALKS